MKLLLIEQTQDLDKELIGVLLNGNYQLDIASDNSEGMLLAESGIYDIIVINCYIIGHEGMELLKMLRRQGIHTPVMMLSEQNDIGECVDCLDCGADDFIVKPCDHRVLLARLRALGRRASDMWDNEALEYGRMRCIPARCEVLSKGQSTRLTLKEMQILECLIRNKNCVLTREQLGHRIWGFNSHHDNNNLEVHMSYLRKKLKNAGAGVQIKTIRGVGYCIKEDVVLISPVIQ